MSVTPERGTAGRKAVAAPALVTGYGRAERDTALEYNGSGVAVEEASHRAIFKDLMDGAGQ